MAAAYTGLISLVFKGIAMWPITVLLIESNPEAAHHVAHHLRATNIAVDIPHKTSEISDFLAAPSTASGRPRVAHPI